MGLLSGTWLSIGTVLHASTPGALSGGLGLLLVSSAGALLTVALAAVITKPLAGRCHPRTLRQMRWANTMLKTQSPRVLTSF
jgi:hypothetical protein